MNIIELLKDQVTSKVLQGDNHFQEEKIGALSAFYPVLLTVLKSKPELINVLQQSLNPKLGDVFSHHTEAVNQFVSLVQGGAPEHEIESTLNRSILPTLSLLGNQSDTDDKQGIFDFIQSQWTHIQAALPAWALGLFSTLGLSVAGLSAAHAAPAVETIIPTPAVDPIVTQPLPREPHPTVVEPEPKKSNWLLPIIALLILAALIAFFLKQCNSKNPEPDVAPVNTTASQVPADLQAAELHIATDATGKVNSCLASSSSQGLLDKLKTSVASIFGQGDQCQSAVNTAYAGDLTDQTALDNILAKIKGIPNASLAWVGNQLMISTPDLAQAQKLADEIKTLAPNLQVTANQTAGASSDVSANVDSSNTQADQALSNIQADKANISDVAAALNLQVINFATGSADIPSANKAILDKAANLLKQLPDAKLVVKGYTDNVGKADANKVLSEKRAKAVASYLVEKGVASSQLTAEGLGQENPVADNSTKEGQFKNRRIEFEVSP